MNRSPPVSKTDAWHHDGGHGHYIKTVDDDISIVVNDPVVTTDLYWNTIERTHR